MAEIGRLLESTRLLSLVGAGGGGKTRLSVEFAASAIGDHPDGVWLVELASLSEGSLVLPAVAGVFELRSNPVSPRSTPWWPTSRTVGCSY